MLLGQGPSNPSFFAQSIAKLWRCTMLLSDENGPYQKLLRDKKVFYFVIIIFIFFFILKSLFFFFNFF